MYFSAPKYIHIDTQIAQRKTRRAKISNKEVAMDNLCKLALAIAGSDSNDSTENPCTGLCRKSSHY